MAVKDIEKEIQDCPKTIFDTFEIKLDLKKSGNALREDLITFFNLYSRVNELANNALYYYNRQKNILEKVTALAWNSVSSTDKVTKQKAIVKDIKVKYSGAETTINHEELKLLEYEYIYNRGRDKVREVSTVLDLGRTLLSWDKMEVSKF